MSELKLHAAVQGDVTIAGTKQGFHAVAAGYDVRGPLIIGATEINGIFSIDPRIQCFDFPNGGGHLCVDFKPRLLKSPTASLPTAYYIQPANEINRTSYFTPVDLTSVGEGKWHGRIQPLEPKLSLYLSIQPAADGSLNAILGNPELNLFHGKSCNVEVCSDTVIFSDTKNPEAKFEGQFDQKTQLLAVRLPNLDKTIQFKRAKSEEAAGFFPRMPSHRNYRYEKPRSGNDGWEPASLTAVGLDSKPIAELIKKILSADPINNPLDIHSVLIARHGKLVLEEYFYGYKGEPHTMRSASKTFAPLLVGIARDENAPLMQPESPVYAQFGGYDRFANPDSRKEKITVRDLMTMTSGLSCDDSDPNSPGNEDVMQQQEEQSDWYKYTLDLPMARDPGGDEAVYCSAGINLLGDIVASRALGGQGLPQFFDEKVAKPLQIKTYHWNLMPNGEGYAGGGLYLRPRDQLKLGQLYLNGGVWNGKRVISKEWVERSTSRQSTFGKTLGFDHDYGYGWHLYHFEVGGRSYRAYAAGGNGGQIVMVIPDLDLVVGFTGGAYGEFPKWYKWQTELVPRFIIPAATSSARH